MRRIRAIGFSDYGRALMEQLKTVLADSEIELITDREGLSLADWTRAAWNSGDDLLFVGAMGIAVRAIAPYAADKLTDPAVIVMDDAGRFAIPVLSGHVGGANTLAAILAEAAGAIPVITTATDGHDAFAADLFAVEHGLRIINRDGIAKVARGSLAGKPVTLTIRDYPPTEPVDVAVTDRPEEMEGLASLVLAPKQVAVGIGCKRGRSCEEILAVLEEVLAGEGIDRSEIGAVASIDRKADEEGLLALSRKLRVPFLTYDAALLMKAPAPEGGFSASQFVEQQVGVDNVCERAALLAAGGFACPGVIAGDAAVGDRLKGARVALITRKFARDGVTVAVAKRMR